MRLPTLVDDLVEEFLIRIPPNDPARLIRAALVCKRWCRLISGAGFRHRFREFHGRAPMLGFLTDFPLGSTNYVRASSTCPPLSICRNLTAIDARHGRILLRRNYPRRGFVAQDPITGERRKLPMPIHSFSRSNAAVLCSATLTAGSSCDHLDCRRGPFFVVFLGCSRWEIFAYIYSSEAGAWSMLISVQYACDGFARLPRALVGNALHFVLKDRKHILKCDLGRREISVIDLPPFSFLRNIALMTTEDGRLGFAEVEYLTLHLWSREAGSDGGVGWTKSKAIGLKTLLPKCAYSKFPYVVGCADDIDVIFLWTSDGIFTLNLKSVRATKVCEDKIIESIFPYTSFYTPDVWSWKLPKSF